ncbi:hypothetical protein WR25_21894 [Diploscapter pachys]|uniref:Phosphotransferase n=1 Tax=Diploscapter pachys TaxID=2018661 RepID=A0A2A2LYH6_9BILA|nr:hypothetical protein WR25_21894 [Diploscapter pachys]
MLGFLELAVAYRTWRDGNPEDPPSARKKLRNELRKTASKLEEESISLESVMAEFKLSNNTLKRMMSHMSDNMDRGLEKGLPGSTIAMLPSFVPELPDGTERGTYVAMDLGGTNLRVMIMHIEPGEPMRTKQFNTRIPDKAMHGSGSQLFDYIAKALCDFLVEKDLADQDLPVGFTFSYPCNQTGLRSATLLRWTKGVTATGVVGKDVVQMLEEAIKRDGRAKVEIVALINDTVGTMVAAAYESGQCDLGVIIGTGTNASYLEDTKKIVYGMQNADDDYLHSQMIIDTEWGGFGDRNEAEYIITQYDKIIDKRSDHPGVNTFDKLVAGMCMGELVRLVLEKLCTSKVLFNGNASKLLKTPGKFPTKYISEILHDEGGSYTNTRQIMDELGIEDFTFSDMLLLREVCMVVSRRSANLAAAAIACVLNRVSKKNLLTVAIDGSTYKYHPFFDHWVTEKVKELLDPGKEFKIVQTGDGSGKGAALIAAIVFRVKKAEEKRKQDEEKLKLEEEKRKLEEMENIRKEKLMEEERARRYQDLLNYGDERISERSNQLS